MCANEKLRFDWFSHFFLIAMANLFLLFSRKNILKSLVDGPVYYKRHFYGGEYFFLDN